MDTPDRYAEDGVDVTLIRWFLTLTPAERLAAAQQQLSAIDRVLKLNSDDRLHSCSADSGRT